MSGRALLRTLWSPLRRHLKRLAQAALLLSLLVAGLLYLAWSVPLPERLSRLPSTVVSYNDGSPAHVFLSGDDKVRMPVQLEDVDPDYLLALLRFEDKRFEHHPGVDPIAVLRAAAVNLRHGRTLSGASTITMQLVRVLEPRPRKLRSKAVEMLRAAQLELRLSKQEILAAYLSFISYGRNLEGIEAAAWAYFGHGARDLAPDEIAVLLAVPQRPARRYPCPENVERLRRARDEIAGWLAGEGALPLGEGDQRVEPSELLEQIRTSPVPSFLRPLPRHAPHAARWLRQNQQETRRLATTLDPSVQALAERVMSEAHGELASLGIHNGAAVVVDHRSAEVKALVGNLDFWDQQHGGQNVGFDAPRSPGSALKPFIYAMALDRGLALPEHRVPDIPVAYGDYAPGNYDGRFSGLVPLEESLSRSLNVPFVQLLGKLGSERFIGTLRACGVSSLRSEPGHYGLSAAIGSAELTPLELAGLYTALAHGGRCRPLRWLDQQPKTTGTRMTSGGAAWLTRRALTRRDRPDFPERRKLSGAPPHIHWKTGTSYGHRDAWAVGSGPRYTAVVWLGNFDNSPAVDLVGSEAAGPLLFDLLEALADRSSPRFHDGPTADLKPIEVCAYSGHLPTPACETTATALALTSHVPTTTCPYHLAVDVDLETGLALNPSCRAGRSWETRSYLVLPASIRRWLGDRHQSYPKPPTLARECAQPGGRRLPPAILSPPAGQVLVLLPDMAPTRQEVPMEADSPSTVARLSWFVDGRFLGTVAADRRLWWTPTPGTHEFLVMDELGLSSRRRLEVRVRR